MAEPDGRRDEEIAEELLGLLRDEESAVPADLPDTTIRRVQSLLTVRDIVDLTTIVFVLQFFAPLLDLIAAMLGHELPDDRGEDRDD